MNKNRPVNLNLTKFHFPPMAILSIGHRIAGVLLFLLLPLMIYLLDASLRSPDTFQSIQLMLHSCRVLQFFVWLMLCAVLFHLLAGIRHLSMDLGFGESVRAGRISAYAVFITAIVLFALAGCWIW